MRAMRITLRAVFVAFSGLVILIGLLWLDHRRSTELPKPTGEFVVGRRMYSWSDDKIDVRSPAPGSKREVFAWVWYPAVSAQPGQLPADYLPPLWRQAVQARRGFLLTSLLTRDLARVRPHSFEDLPVSPRRHRYPVILMRAGLAALTTDYTSLAEDLARHGLVVIGFDAPYRTMVVVRRNGEVVTRTAQNDADRFSGAKQEAVATQLVEAWSADMSFALDQLELLNASTSDPLAGRLNLDRVGAVGHSLGGAMVLMFCHDDPRCKAGVDIDGAPLGRVIGDGVRQPFGFLLSDHSAEPVSETGPVEANIKSIFSRLPADRRSYETIRNAGHFQFSDDGALLKSPGGMTVLRTLGLVGLDGRRQVSVTTSYLANFFDRFLNDGAHLVMDTPASRP